MAKKKKDQAAVSLGSRGGRARAKALTAEELSEQASIAALARWEGTTDEERSGLAGWR